MRAFRLLALMLFGAGLVIQATAYASAQPPAPAEAEPSEARSHCEQMAMSEPDPAKDDEKGEKGCCGDMQMACLVGMNCISPLFPPAAGGLGFAAVQLSGTIYSIPAGTAPSAFARGPEPPPPQFRS